ncbi:MAG: hypothetical protein J6R59_02145 [Paludibacteraceae bacterium]|nr:hypothetical protein [Paludibacteraceae bacterium]
MSRAEYTPFTTEHVEWSAFKWFVYANTCHRLSLIYTLKNRKPHKK